MQTKLALVVDDSRVARLTLGKLLRMQGMDIIEQGSAEEAIAWIQSATVLPDIIFMDVMMTGMDGLTATRNLLADARFAAIPVIICSGKETEADMQAALATGAKAVLSKPPQADALDAVLQGLATDMSAASSATSSFEPEPEPAPQPEVTAEPAVSIETLMATLREQIAADIEQKWAAIKTDVTQQVQQALSSVQAPPSIDSLLSTLTNQFGPKVSEQISQSQNTLMAQAEEKLNQIAQGAVEQAMALSGLEQKVAESVQQHNEVWLAEQKQSVATNLQAELNALLDEKLQPLIEQTLQEKIDEALEEQALSQQIMMQTQQQVINGLQSDIKTQRIVSIVALLAAIGALALSFV
jgi:CheY-like chemotaxis protein